MSINLKFVNVVYLQFSTSNHNHCKIEQSLTTLYIFSFLHQTTTPTVRVNTVVRCISLVFYIKPQHKLYHLLKKMVVYLQFSTSNHNVIPNHREEKNVVYLQFSTSNHNLFTSFIGTTKVVYLQFSTSNHNTGFIICFLNPLYIFSFLHQTTTSRKAVKEYTKLYIFSFLHQTTTRL